MTNKIALIAFEESQTVTIAMRNHGVECYSNDIKDCSGGRPDWHIKQDFFHYMTKNFQRYSFLGAHPVCRYNANSGVRWLTSVNKKPEYEWSDKHQIYINPERWQKMELAALCVKSALSFVKSVGMGYVEQPILHKYAIDIIGEKPTQIIQPWMFGHTTKKATCLWLVNLPILLPTNMVPENLRTDEIHKCAPGPNREEIRSKTFSGIAKAIAEQYGTLLLTQ